MDQPDPIGTLIERLCHTREQLAHELGVSPAALYSWSVGRRSPRAANRSELARIARAHARELADLAAALEPPSTVTSSAPLAGAPTDVPGKHRPWRSEVRELRVRPLDARAPARELVRKGSGFAR